MNPVGPTYYFPRWPVAKIKASKTADSMPGTYNALYCQSIEDFPTRVVLFFF